MFDRWIHLLISRLLSHTWKLEMNASIEALLGGSPAEVTSQLENFSENAKVLSSTRERLIDEYARHWVGVARGSVVVTGDTTDEVIAGLKGQGIDPNDAIIRFIDRELKTMIL